MLEGRWKAINVRGNERASSSAGSGYTGSEIPRPAPVSRPGDGDDAAGSPFKVAVEFRDMGEWQRISRQLSSIPEISELDVEGLSTRGARVSMRYPGGPQSLASVLAQQGMTLSAAGSGWVLTQR